MVRGQVEKGIITCVDIAFSKILKKIPAVLPTFGDKFVKLLNSLAIPAP